MYLLADTFLQKTRQKYNSSRALASRLNLAEMTTDLNLHPPSYIKLHHLEPPPPLPPTPPATPLSGSGDVLARNLKSASTPNGALLYNGTATKDTSTGMKGPYHLEKLVLNLLVTSFHYK